MYLSYAEGKVMIAYPQKELVSTDEASKLSLWDRHMHQRADL